MQVFHLVLVPVFKDKVTLTSIKKGTNTLQECNGSLMKRLREFVLFHQLKIKRGYDDSS